MTTTEPATDLPAEAAGATPRRLTLPHVAAARMRRLRAVADDVAWPRVLPCYSVKTNPDPDFLAAALAQGFAAEVISPEERAWAGAHGARDETTVYNGPYPQPGGRVAYAFADSVEAFDTYAADDGASVIGARLRPAMVRSRFGIPVEDDARLHAAAAALPPTARLGASLHVRRGDLGGASFLDACDDAIARAARLEAIAGRPLIAFDAGGGWTPEALDDGTLAADLAVVAAHVRAALPRVTTLLIEPGQAILAPTAVLMTRVVEVRARPGRRDAVVDAGYGDWPEIHRHAHGFYVREDGEWRRIGPGPDRLLGRTCLEWDLVEGFAFPPTLRAGDLLLVAGVGAYDTSMAFPFAAGGR